MSVAQHMSTTTTTTTGVGSGLFTIKTMQSAEKFLRILIRAVDEAAATHESEDDGAASPVRRRHRSWLADIREALDDKLADLGAAAGEGAMADPRPFLFKLVEWLKNFHINVVSAFDDGCGITDDAAADFSAPPFLPEPVIDWYAAEEEGGEEE